MSSLPLGLAVAPLQYSELRVWYGMVTRIRTRPRSSSTARAGSSSPSTSGSSSSTSLSIATAYLVLPTELARAQPSRAALPAPDPRHDFLDATAGHLGSVRGTLAGGWLAGSERCHVSRLSPSTNRRGERRLRQPSFDPRHSHRSYLGDAVNNDCATRRPRGETVPSSRTGRRNQTPPMSSDSKSSRASHTAEVGRRLAVEREHVEHTANEERPLGGGVGRSRRVAR
jgi:hypothetical protein